MGTSVVKVPYAPQELVAGEISGGNPLSFAIVVPEGAVPGSVGSVSIAADAPFNARVSLEDDSETFGGTYREVDQTLYFQIAGGANPHNQYYQVAPGAAMFLNVTLAHDGKQGGGNWPEPRRLRCECRAAQ